MPPFILNLILSLVLRFGVPWVISFLKAKFPWLPIPDDLVKILEDFIKKMEGHSDAKQAIQAEAKQKLSECLGVGCQSDLKTIRDGEINQ